MERGRTLELVALLLYLAQNILCVIYNFPYGVRVRGMEGQRYHRLHAGKVYGHSAVVIGRLVGVNGLEVALAAVNFIELFGHIVRLPYACEAGGFGSHYVYAEAVVHREVLNSGADKFKHLVLYKALFEGCPYQSYGNVLRAYALFELALEIDGYNFGVLYIIGLTEKLLYKLGAALANRHCTERAVARMAV